MTTVYNKNGVAFDIDNIATDLNGKTDRDLVNIIPIIPTITLIYTGTFQRGDYITFSEDPENFDLLLAMDTGGLPTPYIGNNIPRDGNIKFGASWSGRDSYDGGTYNQTYEISLGNKNGNTYRVWSNAWSENAANFFTEVSKNLKIYGIKFIGGNT